jgi:hypothetical protein
MKLPVIPGPGPPGGGGGVGGGGVGGGGVGGGGVGGGGVGGGGGGGRPPVTTTLRLVVTPVSSVAVKTCVAFEVMVQTPEKLKVPTGPDAIGLTVIVSCAGGGGGGGAAPGKLGYVRT